MPSAGVPIRFQLPDGRWLINATAVAQLLSIAETRVMRLVRNRESDSNPIPAPFKVEEVLALLKIDGPTFHREFLDRSGNGGSRPKLFLEKRIMDWKSTRERPTQLAAFAEIDFSDLLERRSGGASWAALGRHYGCSDSAVRRMHAKMLKEAEAAKTE